MDQVQRKKCGICKRYKYIDDFLKNLREKKTCNKCREHVKKYRNKNRCIHGYWKDLCTDCGGGLIREKTTDHFNTDLGGNSVSSGII